MQKNKNRQQSVLQVNNDTQSKSTYNSTGLEQKLSQSICSVTTNDTKFHHITNNKRNHEFGKRMMLVRYHISSYTCIIV